MKRGIAIFLALVMGLGILTACGKTESGNPPDAAEGTDRGDEVGTGSTEREQRM